MLLGWRYHQQMDINGFQPWCLDSPLFWQEMFHHATILFQIGCNTLTHAASFRKVAKKSQQLFWDVFLWALVYHRLFSQVICTLSSKRALSEIFVNEHNPPLSLKNTFPLSTFRAHLFPPFSEKVKKSGNNERIHFCPKVLQQQHYVLEICNCRKSSL